MANLSNIITTDLTLQAIDQDTEESERTKIRKPPYLGASTIGESCERKIWLAWRMAVVEKFTAMQLYRFEDGYHVENVIASRLGRVSGLTLRTIDPVTGYQFSLVTASGHLRGRVDGRITGLLQAPETEHIWEAKACDEKKVALLEKAKAEHGEKEALKAWDMTYYAQAVLYMYGFGLTRHYLTCSTPGARHTVSVRTNANNNFAKSLIEKAERIKNAPNLPTGISDNPAWWQCKSCTFYALCHEKKVAAVNCRTCLHSTPTDGGEWHCAKYEQIIPSNYQAVGCDNHLFIPSLITFAKAIDANPEENWVEYQEADGGTFKNGAQYDSSHDIFNLTAG